MTYKKEIRRMRWFAAMLMLVAAMVMPSTAWAQGSITPSKPSNGDGSVASPYKIGTPAELFWFAALVNGDTSINGVTAADKAACAELTQDIAVNSGVLKSDGALADNASGFTAWTPISTDDNNPYTGTFDGKGYTISGLYFNNTNRSYYIGLFGYVGSGSKICNVGIVDSYFNGWSGIGGVCGYCTSGEITNCHNTGTVIGTGSNIGGVCGYSSGTITDCYNTGNVIGTSTSNQEGRIGGVCGCNNGYPNMSTITRSYNSGKVSGGYYVGGMCGANGFDFHAKIINCYNTGEVTGTNDDVGGICGFNGASGSRIENCYNSAAVSGSRYVGSVCGFNYSAITTCYYLTTESELSGIGGSDTNAVNNAYGKNAGQFSRGEVCYLLNASEEVFTWRQNLNSDNLPVLEESHGKVYASAPCPAHFSNSQSDLKATEHSYKDGVCEVCGEVDIRPEMIDGVYQLRTSEQLYWFAEQVNGVKNDLDAVLVNNIIVNTGEISESTQDAKVWNPIGKSIAPYTGTFDGRGHTISGLYFNDSSENSGDYVGLFGFVESGGSISNVGVVNSYFNAHQWIGGICGYNKGSITNCYSQSTVSASHSIGGGICGGNRDGGSITNCYNTGNVIGPFYAGGICGICGNNGSSITNCFNTGDVSKFSYTGGVSGYNSDGSLLTNCYYLSSTATGGINGEDAPGSAESKTADQFKSGEVAWLLNGSTSEGTEVAPLMWYQNIIGETKDNFPVLDNTHQVVVECSMPGTKKHGTINVMYEGGENLTPDTNNKIFVVKDRILKIIATPGDNNYIVTPFKIRSGETTYYTLDNTLQISKDFSLNAEFIYGFEQNGYKYEIISGESEENKVRVIMATATEGKLVIPVSVENNSTTYKITEIGKDAFVLAEGLQTLYVMSESPIAIEAESTPFEGIAQSITLRVPYGAKDAYKDENCPWKEFTNILSFTIVNDNIVDCVIINVKTNNESFGGFTIKQDKGDKVETVVNNSEVPFGAALSLTVTPKVDEANGTTYVTVSVKNGDTALTKEEGEGEVYALTVGNEDLNIDIDFALKLFKDENLKYEVIELGGDKVKVTGKVGSATALTIPASVTSPDNNEQSYAVTQIADNAFANDSEITSVEIPASIASIGAKAFSGCSKLKEIIFTGTVPPTIGEGAFDGIHTDALITVPALSVDAYKKALGEALASKVIGDKGVITLTQNQGGKINVYVVNGDTETLQTPADGKVLVDWGTQVKIEAVADEGYVFERLKINNESLGIDKNTYTVRIMRYSPSTVSGQGENFGDITAEASFSVKIATSGGGGTESVTIKGSIDTTGGTQTIIVTHCDEGTESATIPEALGASGTTYIPVTSIAASAFEGCAVLKSVEIPSSITKIGSDAFKGCTSLESFKIKKTTTAMPSTSATRAAARAATDDVTVPVVDANAFDDIVDKATLYVPEGWKEAFKDDAVWSRFTKIKEYRDDENETVLAELTLTASAGGSLTVGAVTSENNTQTVKVAESSNVIVTITPAEGYILGSLLYGGQDVTAQVSGGTLTLTSLEGENSLAAVFSIDTGIGALYDMAKIVYVRDGRIIIDGAAAGEVVIVCDAAGRVLRREVANGEPIELPMAAGKVYIVRIGKQVIKLTM